MRPIREIANKKNILLGIFFILFVLSYTKNVFFISESDLFHGFERQPEGLVVGRLARSAQDGLFSYGGLNGVNSTRDKVSSDEEHGHDLAAQHDLYITNAQLPPYYRAYKSQSAGQALLFGIIHKILPYDNVKKLATYRGLNAILVAFAFLLFGAWVYRNYGFTTSLITLMLIFFSPWLNMFAHNLWWVLWNFYIPFLTMLLLLEYKHNHPDKISQTKIMIGLFAAVFVKCFFSGFEFITTTLISALCPMVYYALKEQQNLKSFILDGIKYSFTMLGAIIAQMMMLITQIKFLDGHFSDGINHIIHSFTKRSEFGEADTQMSFIELLTEYLQNDAFPLGFLNNNVHFYFGAIILIILIASVWIVYKSKDNRALALTCICSLAAPLSWLIIFKQHSVNHMHMDYIIWYMPFILYGFCCIGVAISLFIKEKRAKLFVTK